jgi:hypothetical protein
MFTAKKKGQFFAKSTDDMKKGLPDGSGLKRSNSGWKNIKRLQFKQVTGYRR